MPNAVTLPIPYRSWLLSTEIRYPAIGVTFQRLLQNNQHIPYPFKEPPHLILHAGQPALPTATCYSDMTCEHGVFHVAITPTAVERATLHQLVSSHNDTLEQPTP